MATKTLNTRLQLKYDTHQNWSTNNPVLLAGEIAITTIPSATGDVKQAPSVLMKVGDGTNAYNDLKFISGLAANVSSWALATTKPTYAATEITGLADFIGDKVQDTNTTYQLVKVDDYNYKLQSKEIDGAWADVTGSTIAIPKYDDTTVKADIDALETLVGNTAVATQIANAIAALDLANTYEAKGSAATALASAKTYADGKDAAITAAKNAADAAQADVDALETKVGTVAEGKTVVQMIDDAKTAATYDDTEVRGLISDNTDAIAAIEADYLKAADKTTLQGNIDAVSAKVTTLIGTDADKSVRTIANEELVKQLIPENANESRDTLQEIAAWIQQHPEDAATMNSAIGKNTTDIAGLSTRMSTAEGKITTLEGATHTHTNKALLDTYTQTEANLADAVAKKHSHANTEVLDGITAAKVTSWDGKADATTVEAINTRVGTLETKAVLEDDVLILNCGNSVI